MQNIYRSQSFPVINLSESCSANGTFQDRVTWGVIKDAVAHKWEESRLGMRAINAIEYSLRKWPDYFKEDDPVTFDILLDMKNIGVQTALEIVICMARIGIYIKGVPKRYLIHKPSLLPQS